MIGVSGTTGYGISTHTEMLSDLHVESLLTASDEDSGLCVLLAGSTGLKLFVDPRANLRIADLLSDESTRDYLLEQLKGCRVPHVTSLLDRKHENRVANAVVSFLKDLKEYSPTTLISFDPGEPWVRRLRLHAIKSIFKGGRAKLNAHQSMDWSKNRVVFWP
jgi:hypothetical protein